MSRKKEDGDRPRISGEWRRMALACKGCRYQSNLRTCDYILITKHRRPCQSGKLCTVRLEQKKRKNGPDWELGRTLYLAGKNDTEIAEALGCKAAGVCNWRWKQGLPRRTENQDTLV